MSDDFEQLRRLRPDEVHPEDPAEPTVFTRLKSRLMGSIAPSHQETPVLTLPDIYARLAYNDERSAVEYLGRVFQLHEIREARVEHDDTMLAWLQVGTGVVMVGHANEDIHRIVSPQSVGGTTVQLMVYVPDIDAHYDHAVANGADITMPIQDALYGERRYEATDLEGHRWHFATRTEPPAAGDNQHE
jgi:PhnB protein